jgi:hypothetical protein
MSPIAEVPLFYFSLISTNAPSSLSVVAGPCPWLPESHRRGHATPNPIHCWPTPQLMESCSHTTAASARIWPRLTTTGAASSWPRHPHHIIIGSSVRVRGRGKGGKDGACRDMGGYSPMLHPPLLHPLL